MKDFLKRSFDLLCVPFGLAILGMVIAVYGRKLKKETGEKLFFVQKRVGKNRKEFNIYKLQTMNQKRSLNGDLFPDNDRLGPIGNKLRRLRLDEFANFINVALGHMSVVGPRPHMKQDVWVALDVERHLVKPGITSLTKLKIGNDNHLIEGISDVLEVRQQFKLSALGVVRKDIHICFKTIAYALAAKKDCKNDHTTEKKTFYVCPFKKSLSN